MAAVASHADEGERLLDEALTGYFRAVDAGHTPDREELLARYPDLAPDLGRFLDTQSAFDRWAGPVRHLCSMADSTDAPPGLPSPAGFGAFGDYELLGSVGQGGMGAVFRARQRGVPRQVALKVVRAGAAASANDVRRFRNEVETVAGLDHPGIVPVFDAGERDGSLYFAMKLYEGGSLADHLRQFAADPRGAARLVAEVARAVHHAHQRGVLHRDLKPSNVLLDAEGRPAVADFGLARRLDADGELTRTGVLVGTPSYMAPEVAAGRRGAATVAADVYGIGAVLYALLTGRPPFRRETVAETLELVRSREPEPPRQLNPRVGRDLETICLKCLAKEPGRRYASAVELADDLERWLVGEPVRARRPRPWEVVRSWVRRRPAPAAALAVLALAVVVLLVGLLWHNDRLRAEAEKTARERDAARDEARWAARAVDDMYTRVAEDWLGPRPRLQPLQRDFLEKALAYYQRAADRWSDEPEVRRKLPELHLRVGVIHAALGRHDRAEESLRDAVARFRELRESSPAGPVVREQELHAHIRLVGILLATGRPREAVTADGEVCDLAARLMADFPDRTDFARYPAIARGNLAFALAEAGRHPEAEAAYREALPELNRLVERDGADAQARSALANARTNLGKLYLDSGRTAEAEPLLREAAAGFERLTRDVPGNAEYAWSLATTLSNRGIALFRVERVAEARTVLVRAEGLMDRQAADFPDLPDGLSDLAVVRMNLGVVLKALGETGEAEKCYGRAIQTLSGLTDRFPEVADYPLRLGKAQFNLGRLLRQVDRLADSEGAFREACATLQKLVARYPAVAVYRVECADALLNLGQVLSQADRHGQADDAFARTVELREKLLADEPENPAYRAATALACANQVLGLTYYAGPPYRDAGRALELARRAAELGPRSAFHRQAIALAEFRLGNWRETLAALERAREFGGGEGPHTFVQAMAHQQLGETGKARERYEAGVRWLEKLKKPGRHDVRLRDEAAALLGLPRGPSERGPATPGPSRP